MFYHEDRLQYPVEVEEPDPVFAKMLQQAIGGIEGEMRVALQYFFQAAAVPDEHAEYREALRDTAAEELAHIEMLATAVNENLQGAPVSLGDVGGGPEFSQLSGIHPRQFLSAGQHAIAADSNGVPFNGSWIVASGNLAADMYANIMAESTGRLLATRLYEVTDDPGMKDMLAFLIARDTMHQNQWISILQDLGDPEELLDVHPIPDSFPDEVENQEFNYAYLSTNLDPGDAPDQPWTQGEAPDMEGDFEFVNQHDVEGAAVSVPQADPRTYNNPNPRNEDENGDEQADGGETETSTGDEDTETATPEGSATPEDAETVTPTEGNETASPTEDNEAATPTGGNETASPTEDNETATPTEEAAPTPEDED